MKPGPRLSRFHRTDKAAGSTAIVPGQLRVAPRSVSAPTEGGKHEAEQVAARRPDHVDRAPPYPKDGKAQRALGEVGEQCCRAEPPAADESIVSRTPRPCATARRLPNFRKGRKRFRPPCKQHVAELSADVKRGSII